jgi:hypothetical protein
MQLALNNSIEPKNMALGAMAGIAILLNKAEENNLPEELRFKDWRKLDRIQTGKLLRWLWNTKKNRGQIDRAIKFLINAKKYLDCTF